MARSGYARTTNPTRGISAITEPCLDGNSIIPSGYVCRSCYRKALKKIPSPWQLARFTSHDLCSVPQNARTRRKLIEVSTDKDIDWSRDVEVQRTVKFQRNLKSLNQKFANFLSLSLSLFLLSFQLSFRFHFLSSFGISLRAAEIFFQLHGANYFQLRNHETATRCPNA